MTIYARKQYLSRFPSNLNKFISLGTMTRGKRTESYPNRKAATLAASSA